MNNRLDKLFKDKLSDHAEAPPASAWEKVEAGLSKKNKGQIVYRLAAGLLLVAVSTWTILWMQSRDQKSNVPAISKVIAPQIPRATPQKNDLPKNEIMAAVIKKQPVQQQKLHVTTHMSNPVAAITLETTLPVDPPTENHVADITATPVTSPSTLEVVAEKISKPIVLEYTLVPAPIPAEAETQPKALASDVRGKNGLQKVLDFARDAKNSDGALSELRQAKDGLFALNFKKDKQKNPK